VALELQPAVPMLSTDNDIKHFVVLSYGHTFGRHCGWRIVFDIVTNVLDNGNIINYAVCNRVESLNFGGSND
jgi:hypothetical protein